MEAQAILNRIRALDRQVCCNPDSVSALGALPDDATEESTILYKTFRRGILIGLGMAEEAVRRERQETEPPWQQQVAEAARFETGKTFAIVRMNTDRSFDQTGLYERKETAFKQQTRQLNAGLDRGDVSYVYVVALYPNGRVVYASRDTILYDGLFSEYRQGASNGG